MDLGFRPMPSGQGVVEFALPNDTLLNYRNANGTLTLYFRMACLSGASGSVVWSTDQLALYMVPGLAPMAPASVNAVGGTARATVSWSASSGADPGTTSYGLRYGTSPGVYTTTLNGVYSPYVVNGLTNGTRYYFAVFAANSRRGIDSEEASAVPIAIPANPTAVPGNGQIALSWGASAGAAGYRVYYGTSPGNYPSSVFTSATSAVVGGLPNGTTYYFAVTGTNTVGESDPSAEVAAAAGIPAAPTGLAATGRTGGVDLAWTASPNATAYTVRWGTASGAYTASKSVSGTTTNVGGLANGTKVYFVVQATNGAGASANSAEASATPIAVPLSVVATPGDGQVALSWNAAAGATGYKVKYGTAPGGPYPGVANPTAPSSTVVGLTNGTTYYFTVAGTNTIGEGDPSAEASAKPSVPVPAAPTGLTATAASSSKINLAWTDNASNETGFLIERKLGASGTFAQVGTAPANAVTFQDAGLAASTAYVYRVRATNAGGNSAYSNEAGATTMPPPPTPSVLSAISLQDDYLTSGSGTVLTVYLSATRTTPAVVSLTPRAGLTMPSQVTVPAGQLSASVTVTSASSVQPTIFPLVASLENWKQKAYLVVTPNASTFAINGLNVRTGQGVALLSWVSQREEIFGTTIKGYEVWRKVGSTEQKISVAPSGESRFVDAHCTQTGTQYKIRLVTRTGSVLAETAYVSVVPSSEPPSISVSNTPTTPVTNSITFGLDPTSLHSRLASVYVDGTEIGSVEAARRSNGAAFSVDARRLSNGSHECIIVAEDGSSLRASSAFPVTVSAVFDAIRYEDVVDGSIDEVAQFSIDLPDAPRRAVRAEIVAPDGSVSRSFQSSSDKLNFAWDGKDSTGIQLAAMQYKIRITPIDSDDPNSTGGTPFEDYICKVMGPPTYLSLTTLFKGSEVEDDLEVNKVVDVFRSRSVQNSVGALVLKISEGQEVSRRLRLRIRDWMINNVACLHISAHGVPYTSRDGSRLWTAVKWGGLMFHPQLEAMNENGILIDQFIPDREFCVGAYLYGGGLPPSGRPFTTRDSVTILARLRGERRTRREPRSRATSEAAPHCSSGGTPRA